MPGEFSKSNRPRRPGAYFAFEAIQQVQPPPNIGSIVAISFTADWGPLRTATLLRSFQDYLAVFGDSTDTQGYRAVRQAFQGEGLPGFGGAGSVLAYRVAASSAAKAAHTFVNSSPASALTVTARYEGTRGNDLNITIQDLAGTQSPEADEFIVYDGATEVERFTYVDTDVAGLVAQINSGSDFLTAAVVIDGVGLTPVANVALTAGADGTTLIAGDYTAMMSALEIERFSVLSMETPSDSGILASLVLWTQNLRRNGKRFRLVVGGATDELAATAITRSGTINDPGIVNLGIGHVTDPILGALSTAQLAPRVAGILSARGETASLTFARFGGGLVLSIGATDSEILRCFDAGVTVLARDSNAQAPVRIEKGLTTYTTTTNVDKPYLIFRDPKFIATMDGMQMEFTEYAEAEIIGKMQITAATRSFVRAAIAQRMQAREDAGIIQPGWTVEIDNNPPPTPTDDFLAYAIGLRFGRSTEQIYFTTSVG